MRVLLVTHYYGEHRGGVEIVAGELARRLAAAGNGITWVASAGTGPSEPDGITRMPMLAWNVTENRLGFPYPLWSPWALWHLGCLVAAADVIHLHDSLYLGNVTTWAWARWHRKPVVVTQHVGPVPYSSRILRGLLGVANRTLARLVLGGADQVIFISPRVQAFFARLVRYRRPPLYLANGVDNDRFYPAGDAERQALRVRLGWPPERKVRLFVGRFVEKKGLPLLRQLAASRPQDRWVFIGWGPNDPATWGLANVEAVGALPQQAIADYYRAADLLMLPSVGEGFPLVVQEAMACGLPALISPETLEGTPDAAEAIASAALDPLAWAEAIERLDRDAARRRRAAAFAQRWSWDTAAERYAAIFAALCAKAQ